MNCKDGYILYDNYCYKKCDEGYFLNFKKKSCDKIDIKKPFKPILYEPQPISYCPENTFINFSLCYPEKFKECPEYYIKKNNYCYKIIESKPTIIKPLYYNPKMKNIKFGEICPEKYNQSLYSCYDKCDVDYNNSNAGVSLCIFN